MASTRALAKTSLVFVLLVTFLAIAGTTLAAPSPASIDQLLRKGEESLAQTHLATADTSFREALQLALVAGDRKREAAARNGIVRTFPGNGWEVLAHLRLALAIHRELSDLRGQASDLAAMGEIYQVHGFSSKAMPSLQEALAIAQKLGLQREEGRIRETLGVAEQALGSYEEAEAHLATALERRREAGGDPFELLRLEVRLGSLRALLGRYELAEENLIAALGRLTRSRTQISKQQWAELRAAWVAQGQGFLQGMGPMAATLAQSLNTDGDEDPELSRAMSQILAEEQGATFGQALPFSMLKLMRGAVSYNLKAVEDSEVAFSKIVKPEQIHILLVSPTCEMEILTTLSRTYLQIGRPKEAAAMKERAWDLVAQDLEKDERLLSIFHSNGPDAGVAQERQTAYKLGLPIPPTFSDACAKNDPARSGEKLWAGDLAAAQGRVDDAIQKYQEFVKSNPPMRPMGLTRLASLYEKKGIKAAPSPPTVRLSMPPKPCKAISGWMSW